MGRAGSSMTWSSLGEDGPLECATKLDKGTSEPANNAFAIALRIGFRKERTERANG